MLKFKPSIMRHTATIQSKTDTQDSEGLTTTAWADVFTNVPCSIVALSGKEFVSMQSISSEINVRITIHKMAIDTSMRIVANSKNYNLVTILPDMTDNVYLTIMAREGLSNG